MLEKNVKYLEHEIDYLKKMNAFLVKRVAELEKDRVSVFEKILIALLPIVVLTLLVVLLGI